VGLEIRFTAKTKATWFLRWLEFKELFGPDFKGAIQTTAA